MGQLVDFHHPWVSDHATRENRTKTLGACRLGCRTTGCLSWQRSATMDYFHLGRTILRGGDCSDFSCTLVGRRTLQTGRVQSGALRLGDAAQYSRHLRELVSALVLSLNNVPLSIPEEVVEAIRVAEETHGSRLRSCRVASGSDGGIHETSSRAERQSYPPKPEHTMAE